MRVFISGGCKNGKSSFAQKLAKNQAKTGELYYIATMIPSDSEDDERIKRHRQERDGWGFTTVEQPRNIEEILSKCDKNGTFLLDSLTALLANEMFSKSGDFDEKASERVITGLAKVLGKLKNIIVVSDYIYSDAIIFDPLTETYRKSLAELDCLAAQKCEVVVEVTFWQTTVHKAGGKIHPERLARSALAEGVSSLRNQIALAEGVSSLQSQNTLAEGVSSLRNQSALAEGVSSLQSQNTLAEGVSSLRNHCHEGVL